MRLPRWLSRSHRKGTACPECGGSVHETYCEVCGYDLVRKTRTDLGVRRPTF